MLTVETNFVKLEDEPLFYSRPKALRNEDGKRVIQASRLDADPAAIVGPSLAM